MKPKEPRVYKGTIYLLNTEGKEIQIRGFMCKGTNKDDAHSDAVKQASKIWPFSRVTVGGLKWIKGAARERLNF